MSVRLLTKWFWVPISLLLLRFQIWPFLWARSSLAFRKTTECGFTLKHVRQLILTYSQMHHTDKYWQHSSIIWPVWLNVWMFDYELSGCGFVSRCSHNNIQFSFVLYSIRNRFDSHTYSSWYSFIFYICHHNWGSFFEKCCYYISHILSSRFTCFCNLWNLCIVFYLFDWFLKSWLSRSTINA